MHPTFPLPDLTEPVTAPFWAAAAEGVLAVPRCASCDRWCWYPKDACPACGSTDLPWTPTSGRGTLFSWVVVHHPFLPAFADQVPFVTALVALDDDPAVRIATRFVDASPDVLRIDRPVEVTFGPLRYSTVDAEVQAPFFRPA